ncbi:MAG: hypothetical protein VX705_01465 [Verrucomicrobiota bacterium]|nr:hypothetical protein [Verrucomicrobiota bacterium]
MKTRVLLFGFWLFSFALYAAEPKSGLTVISVPEGFAVELAAGSELAPYGMLANFDGKGRLERVVGFTADGRTTRTVRYELKPPTTCRQG